MLRISFNIFRRIHHDKAKNFEESLSSEAVASVVDEPELPDASTALAI